MTSQSLFPQRLFLCLLILLFSFAGCDSSPSQETMLKEQVGLLQNQVKGWQEHYLRLLCLQDSLQSVESLDQALEGGLSLSAYQQKIVAVDLLLESINCADKGELLEIMAWHHLAARMWEARNQGKAGELAEDFVRQVYPLWLQFDYPWPDALSRDLKEALDSYEQAAGPQAHNIMEQVQKALNTPQSMAIMAGIANQLLWHQAHNQLQAYKTRLLTPPYPLQ